MNRYSKGLFGIINLFILTTHVKSETTFQATYGGTGYYSGESVQEIQDGGYIVSGTFTYWDSGYCSGVYLIRIDAAGDTLWTRTYGGSESESGNSIQETLDGGFIIAGLTASFGADSVQVYVIKTDSLGNSSSNPIKAED